MHSMMILNILYRLGFSITRLKNLYLKKMYYLLLLKITLVFISIFFIYSLKT